MQALSISVAKLSQVINLDFDKLPEQSQYVLAAYGAKQLLNDKTAGKDEAESEKRVLETVAALEAGTYTLREQGEGRKTPLERMALDIATAAVKSALVAKGKKADRETISALAKTLALREDVLAKAKVQLEAVAAITLEDIAV